MIARFVVKNRQQLFQAASPLSQHAAISKRYPSAYIIAGVNGVNREDVILDLKKRTLIFAITSLHFLMRVFLNLSFQNSRTSRFVELGNFQNMRGVDPIVGSSTHNMVAINIILVYGNLHRRSVRMPV